MGITASLSQLLVILRIRVKKVSWWTKYKNQKKYIEKGGCLSALMQKRLSDNDGCELWLASVFRAQWKLSGGKAIV